MNLIKEHIRQMDDSEPPSLKVRDSRAQLFLNLNERTVPLPERIDHAIKDFLNQGRIMAYPSYGNLTAKIASYAEIEASQTLCTNGSTQGIDLVVRAITAPGDEIIIPIPYFAMYWQIARVNGLSIAEVPYNSDEFRFPDDDLKRIISKRTKLVVIANPHNPTGMLLPGEEILELVQDNPGAVFLVDEAYFEYSDTTVKDHVEEFENLFILRSFSKAWGLAALRIGYIISSQENIAQLLKIQCPYEVNQLAVVAAQAALEDPSYVRLYAREIMEKSKPMMETFFIERSVPFWPSAANFLLWYPCNCQAVYEYLESKGVLTCPTSDSRGTPCLRITLGNQRQTRSVLTLLKECNFGMVGCRELTVYTSNTER
jgi:histidinol-phosphate aminotransferase